MFIRSFRDFEISAENYSSDSSKKSNCSFEPVMTMESVLEGNEPQILVVDDQAIALICMMGTIENLGETTIGKLSGTEALSVVQRRLEA